MAEIILNIGDPKSKKTVSQKLSADDSKHFFGKKLGDVVRGELFGRAGYEFTITGGSDKAGFPMRRDIEGQGIKKILTGKGTGIKGKSFRVHAGGLRRKKTMAGNTVGENTVQINLKVVKYGAEPLIKEEKPAETEKKEEVKPEPKEEEKPVEEKK